MTWASIATQFVLTVGASLAERLAAALSARIKSEPEPEANPVDIAIATKSAVSADREGKIASERGQTVRRCNHCGLRTEGLASDGLCRKCEHLRAPQPKQERVECGRCGANIPEWANKSCIVCALDAPGAIKPRRLGDYGPGGG